MRDRAIVSCCYSPHNHGYYATYADRLERSLDEFGPDADRIIWRKEWPPHSPSHQEANYAFKWYAVNEAFNRGYRYVLWLDAGTEALAPIDPIWTRVSSLGYALLRGCDRLWKWISDEALAHFSYKREDIVNLSLFGGCMIGIDRESAVGMEFFKWWGEIVKVKRLLMGAHRFQVGAGQVMRSVLLSDADMTPISTNELVEGHRSDEACFSLMADKMKLEPMPLTEWEKVCRTY